MAHKLDLNFEALIYDIKSSENMDYEYCTINFYDFLLLKSNYWKCKFLLSPLTWLKLFNSKIIICSHGIYFEKIFHKFSSCKTIYLPHAFRTGINTKTNQKLEKFDEVWLSTEYEKYVYLNETKYTGKNLFVTGYPKYDIAKEYQINKKTKQLKIKEDYKINKIISVGQTRNYENKNLKYQDFSIYNLNFLKKLEQIGKENNILFIICIHPTAKNLPRLNISLIKKSKKLFFYTDLKLKNSMESLSVSDFLISDYSTLLIDSIFFKNKPIILKTSLNKKIKTLSVLDEFNVFEFKNLNFYNTFDYSKKTHEINNLFSKFIGNQFDSKISSICMDRIENILIS